MAGAANRPTCACDILRFLYAPTRVQVQAMAAGWESGRAGEQRGWKDGGQMHMRPIGWKGVTDDTNDLAADQ
jgi:hypothetical protein